jgi:zinc D-Ala-D-Ala carboxypeptidase
MADNNFEGTNLLGGPFKPYVDKQVAQRQERLGKIQKDNQEIVWQNAKSAYVALASSVNIENSIYTTTTITQVVDTSFTDLVQNRSTMPQDPTFADLALNTPTKDVETSITYTYDDGTKRLQQLGLGSSDNFLGNKLANNIVLFGGTAYFEVNSSGSYSNPYYRSGLATSDSILNNSAYGFGGTSFGLSVMPGITSFNIKSRNMGSLREASVTIRANNEKQFSLIDSLYCRIGYSMFIEWGNSIYFNNDGKYVSNPNAEGVTSLLPIFLSGKNGNKVISDNPNQFLELIEKRREKSNGNYDAFFGKVKNFSWEFNKAGYYEISLSLISQGDIIESLNIDGQYGGISTNPLGSGANQPQPNETSALTSFISTAAAPNIKKQIKKGSIGKGFDIRISNNKNTLLPSIQSSVVTYSNKTKTNTLTTSSIQLPSDTIESLSYTRLKNSVGKIVSATATFGSNDPYFYIRLGDILDFIKDRLLIYTSKGDNEPILDIDTDTDKNIMYNPGINVSADPSKVMVKTSLPYSKSELKTIALNTTSSITPLTENIFNYTKGGLIESWVSTSNPNDPTEEFPLHGKIMNIYFEYQYLINAIKNLRNEQTGTISLYDFVDELCQTVNSCLGGVNKLSIRLEDDKIMRIYDQNPIYGTQNVKNSIINLYGINPTLNSSGSVVGRDGSFVTDFNIKTELTNDFATQVTIGAQAQSNNVGSDATGLSSWNSGLKDRFFPEKIDSLRKNNNITVPTTEERINKLKIQLSKLWLGYSEGNIRSIKGPKQNQFIRFEFYWFENFDTKRYSEFVKLQKDWLQEIIKLENENFNKTQVKEDKQTLGTNQIGMLPINISVTMEGLSGIRIYDKLEVDTRFLPKYYPQTLIWIIKGVSHEIQNNKWYTKLETIAVPKLPIEQNFDEALGKNKLNVEDEIIDIDDVTWDGSYPLDTLTVTTTGIDNSPTPTIIQALKSLDDNILIPITNEFGTMLITSAYRSKAVNLAIGGSTTSQHQFGEAVDFVAVGGGKELNEVFTWIADNLTFGQLIWEKGDDDNPQWIHVSDATARFGKSGEILRFDPSGSPQYKPCDKFGKRT